jgi:hypothetical protein
MNRAFGPSQVVTLGSGDNSVQDLAEILEATEEESISG